MSAEAGVAHLQRVLAETCDALDPLLGRIECQSIVPLTQQESEALSWLLHPWGPARIEQANLPKWLQKVAVELGVRPVNREPPTIAISSSEDAPPHSATPRDLAAWYAPILCETLASNKDGPLSRGSGVVISRDGLVLTCAHVLNGPLLTIRIHEGEWKGEYDVEAVFVNQARDVALLRAKGLHTNRWAPVRLDRPSTRGEQIIAMGNPGVQGGGTSYAAVTSGIVSNPHVDRSSGRVLIADVNIASGSSGGPLIAVEDGAVIGIIQAISKAGLTIETGDAVASSGYSCLAAPSDAAGDWLGLVAAP